MVTIIRGNATNTAPVSILVAEDDIDDQELLDQAIQSLSPEASVGFITNGNNFRLYLEGLDESSLPKVILLDYNLPEITGVEILKLLRSSERLKAIPKMIWSTSNSSIFREQSLQYGAVAYFVKPINFDAFTAIAEKLLYYV